ncbi:MAG: glycosyltransferase, partial [Nitrospirae bacterium]|nr:glycosyltransferase [Nitrospirota bacterium]
GLVEGFGNIIVEAMACGVPVVATDCPCGPREIIRDGESGILVPMDDSEALAQTIHRLLHDRGRRELLAEQGSLRARDFSIGRMVKAYEEFFLQVQA